MSEREQQSGSAAEATSDARRLFEAGLRAVRADRLLEEDRWRHHLPADLGAYDRIIVVGMGKASMALAGEMERHLGMRLNRGVVVVPHGYPDSFPRELSRPVEIQVLQAGHPVPDAASQHAARRILEEAQRCRPNDLLIVLISGGGSALCADFVGDIRLDEAREAFGLLLASGADIYAMNTVRKHISRIGGGRLAAAAQGCDVLALVVSDVVGDDLSVIASGPTMPDASTADEAIEILHDLRIWPDVPHSVRAHLEAVRADSALETPSDAAIFARVRTELLGTNRQALEAAAAAGRKRGYRVKLMSDQVTGEARSVGAQMARQSLDSDVGRRCLLWGGETTVTVHGDGSGGRNQELALAAAIELEHASRAVVLLSGGTDGRDGPTPAAGAVATSETVRWARRQGLQPCDFLERNDSHHFWKEAGGLLVTGATHTNVMDLQVAMLT